MDKRYSTIILVPHARAKFRKLKVSHRVLFSALSLLASSLCLSTFFSVQYFTSLSQTHELSKLRRENRDLQSANEQFSKSVESLRTQLHKVEDRTRKLAIIAGITTLDEARRGGSGGLRNDELSPNPYRDDIDKMSFRSRTLQKDLNVLEQNPGKTWSDFLGANFVQRAETPQSVEEEVDQGTGAAEDEDADLETFKL